MSDDRLAFATLALRRLLASEHVELSPATVPGVVAYGTDDGARAELQLALSELCDEGYPPSVARLLLPDGVRVEHVEVELAREARGASGEPPGRLGRPLRVTLAVVVVPEPRAEGGPSGRWAFVPVLDHACFVPRGEDLATRVAADVAALPAALDLDLDGWKRAITWADVALEPLAVELTAAPAARAQGQRALADAERKRQARATLEGAAQRLQPAEAPPLVGREAIAAELARALDAGARRSVLLVGDEAAGKSALVLAWAAAHPDRELWATSASELVAGASGLGQWQERVAAVLAAAEALDAILYFDDFGALFADRPAEGGIELPGALRRHVVEGRVRVVGELTERALDRAERRDASLIGAMPRVRVPPTDPATTIEACRAWAARWAKAEPHRPRIAPEAIPVAVELARRYLPYRAFPGKAVRLLEELRVAHDGSRDADGKGPLLGESALYASVSWATGIPLALLDDQRAVSRDQVIAELRRRMVGQDAAVRRVAEALCVAKARMQPADKPLASLLFVGPSGVGKTELARSVAAYLFGSPDKMVRLDMSEYTDPWAAERLFGGAYEDGRLTAAVRSQPFGVVLLDEIEKAHPSVWDLLLQVLGEARLTDGRGRTTYFHNAIVVLTSNLGTRGAKARLGLQPEAGRAAEAERRYTDAVLAAFRPELVNRLDQIVVFHPLEPDQIARVAEIATARLADRRGLTQAGVLLDVSPAALARLAEGGFSAELGARALRRHLDEQVVLPAARLLAAAGAEAHGGTLTVRAPDEAVDPADRSESGRLHLRRDAGQRLGEHAGAVHVALWRRGATTGRRLVKGALALAALRRDTDRELALPAARAVKDTIGQLEATLATAQRAGGRKPLSGEQIARLSTQHAHLVARLAACAAAQGELHAAEELCLEALARDLDAIDLIDGAVLHRQTFRRALFWLLVALRPHTEGATLLVHTPDAPAAVTAWATLVLEAAAHHGWRASVHLPGEQAPGWTGGAWGPPHDRAWAAERLGAIAPTAALVRISGHGANVLFGPEAGLHRFDGFAAERCHAWVEPLEPRAELSPEEWVRLPGPPPPRAARGQPVRHVTLPAGRVAALGEALDETDVPWSELPRRLAEATVTVLLAALAEERADALFRWDHPLGKAAPG